MTTQLSEKAQNLMLNALYCDVFAKNDLSDDLGYSARHFSRSKATDTPLQDRVSQFIAGLESYISSLDLPLTPSLMAWAVKKMPCTDPDRLAENLAEQLQIITWVMQTAKLALVDLSDISRHDVRFFGVYSTLSWLTDAKKTRDLAKVETVLKSIQGQIMLELVHYFELSVMGKLEALELNGVQTIQAMQLIVGKLLHDSAENISFTEVENIKGTIEKLTAHLAQKAFDPVCLEHEALELNHQIQECWKILAQYKLSKADELLHKLKHSGKHIQVMKVPTSVVVCIDPMPPSSDKHEKEALQRYEVLRSPMALMPQPELTTIDILEESLKQEFPWALLTIEAIVHELRGRTMAGSPHLFIAPKLLYGAAGCGKNRFVRRLAEILGQAYTNIAVGGHGDVKTVSGTARGWGGAKPSPIVELIMTRQCANPLVLLDEIDKTANHSGAYSPPVASILLQFLERENASNFMDSFLQARCNLSYVSYFATSNSLETIPAPLLSRLQVLPMPSPQPKHFRLIFQNVLRDEAKQLGVPEEYFDNFSLELAFDIDRCQSIRDIQRQVRTISSEWLATARSKDRLH